MTTDSADEVRVIRPSERAPDTASGAMLREAAISRSLVGARKIWVGYVELGPGLISAAHHHGEAESAIYIVSGRASFYVGEQLATRRDAGPGDFVWVPPHVVHIEMNTSVEEPVRMVVARSTQETLVFNVPTPEGWKPA
jgi:uncharacterized RmlC-like cupin family protein